MTSRPAIVLVSEMAPPPGGMAVQAALLAEGLEAAGHRVIRLRTNPLPHGSWIRAVPVLRGVVNYLCFMMLMLARLPRGDCVHLFSHSYLSFFLFSAPTVLYARLLGRRLLVHYHGGAAGEFLGRFGWAARPLLRLARYRVVPSGFLDTVFRAHGLACVQVPNILAVDRLPFRRRRPLQPALIMARHLEPAYNCVCGIRAFAEVRRVHPRARLRIAGDGSERRALTALVHELGLVGSVEFLGNLDRATMIRCFDESDIYLNASRVDNQPVSLTEALACGLPVVSTAVGGIPYMVRHEETALLADDNDAHGLAAQILRVLDDPALAEALIRNGREEARNYGWDSVYNKLSLLYAR